MSEKTELIERRDTRRRAMERLDRVAALMDDRFEIPIVGVRVGLDPLIGLIPGGGDWVVWFVSVYIFWEGLRLGASFETLLRMAANIAIDLVVGYIPGAGDLFDVLFKANRKNVELLRTEMVGTKPGDELPELPQHSKAARYALGIAIVLSLFALAAVPFVVLYFVLRS
jgi:hypothetical protein